MCRAVLLAALTLPLALGCGPKSSPPATSSVPESKPQAAKADDGSCPACDACTVDDDVKEDPASLPDGPVELEVVKLDQLTAALAAHKGKVVVVDVWASYCGPCKKEFPQLVKLHQKYGKAGLVCVSVSVDLPVDKEATLKFLQARGAAFPNYLLNESPAVWQQKWNITGVPAVLVYGRDGNQAARFDNEDPAKAFTYAEVEKRVQELLGAKP